MRIVVTMIGLGALLAAVPAAAADPAATSSKTKSTAAKSSKEPTYCIQYEADTGSRIGETVCKTKSDWAKDGVNVDDLAKPKR